MSREHHSRVKEIFFAALERDREHRDAYLVEACTGDDVLLAELREMIALDEREDPLLDQPLENTWTLTLDGPSEQAAATNKPTQVHSALERLASARAPGQRYEVLGEFARGGMGAILRVRDPDLRRTLAMKVALVDTQRGHSRDQVTLARFLEEAQVTGQLDHPGIVPVHELGVDAEGRAFFTMKLVRGRDLKQIFDLVQTQAEGWNQARAIGVLLKVCEAMAYAHSKGVLHRDLKPSNIMVGRFGEVYVMDWGLAHVMGQQDERDLRIRDVTSESGVLVRTDRREESSADSPLLTMDGDVVGTPAYMSPEQARGEIRSMGTASDVWSLGAILYHLLAGHMPYAEPGQRASAHEIWSRVCAGSPPSLDRIAPSTPEELVSICSKAMAYEPRARYAEVLELAEDLRAYVEGRVVKAHRTGTRVEVRKWVGRNRSLSGALLAATLLLVAGTATSSVLFLRARTKAIEAERSETQAREQEARANREAERANREAQRANQQAAKAGEAAARVRQQSYVANLRAASIGYEAQTWSAMGQALAACPAELRGWEWQRYDLLETLARRGWNQPIELAQEPVAALAMSPGGTRLASAVDSGPIVLRDERGHVRAELETQGAAVKVLVFGASDLSLGWGLDDGRIVLRQGQDQRILEGHVGPVTCLTLDEEQGVVLSGGADGCVRLWDQGSGRPLATLPGHEGGVQSAFLLADGTRLLTLSGQSLQRLWERSTQELIDVRTVSALAAMPGASRFARSEGANVMLCDAGTGGVQRSLEAHQDEVYRLGWTPDAERLISVSWDGTMRWWDAEGSELAVVPAHEDFVSGWAFAGKGDVLATASWDRTVRLWNSRDGRSIATLPQHSGFVRRLAMDASGTRLVTGTQGSLQLWDAVAGEGVRRWSLGAAPRRMAFDEAGLRIQTETGEVLLWKRARKEPLPLPEAEEDCQRDELPSFWRRWRGETLACVLRHRTSLVAASEEWVVAGCRNGAGVFRRADGERVCELRPSEHGFRRSFTALDIASSGSRVASADAEGTALLWQLPGGELVTRLTGHSTPLTELTFAMDEEGTTTRLVGASETGSLFVWDGQAGTFLGELHRPPVQGAPLDSEDRRVGGLVAHPDGRRLFAGFADGTLGMFDLAQLTCSSLKPGHQRRITCLDLNPSGTRLATGSLDNDVAVWDASSGEKLARLVGPRLELPVEEEEPREEELTPDSLQEETGVRNQRAEAANSEAVSAWQRALDVVSGRPSGVTHVTFSQDGSRLAAAFVEGSLRIWLTDLAEARSAWILEQGE